MQGQVGRYQVVGELGRGGMGVVYRALDPSSGREVALKVLPPLADAEERQRFSREAETARAIDHPNVLAVLELGQERGRPYLVTELAPGGSLADRLRRAPLDPEEAARVVAQVARGLAAAHERGALHRDLKPGNVLFAADGRALLADFGLARRVRDETLTATGTVLGTPGYMSPEQAQGERADERSDVYGLGSLLYAALVGQPPFRGRSLLETLTAVVNDPAPAPAGAPSELAAIACRCMAKDPRERYPSASAVAEALAGLGAGSGAKSLSAGAWLAALALATAGLLAWGWSGRATPRSAPTPLAQARATASDAPPAPASSSPAPTPRATQAATPKGESGVTLPEDDRQLDDLGLDDAALRRLQAQVEERLDREGESPRVLVNLGRVLVARRQHTAAAALARKAIRLDPEFGAAYRLLALVLNAQGAYDQALEELTQALAIDPQDWQALRERGGVWFSTQKPERAVEDLSASIELHPSASAHWLRGLAWRQLRRGAQADADFLAAHELEPKNPVHLRNLLALAARRKDWDLVEDYARQLLELLPQDSDAFESLLVALKEAGRWQSASQLAKEAARFPDHLRIQLLLGRAQLEVKQLELAEASAQRALKLAPRHDMSLLFALQVAVARGDPEQVYARGSQLLSLRPEEHSLDEETLASVRAIVADAARRLGR